MIESYMSETIYIYRPTRDDFGVTTWVSSSSLCRIERTNTVVKKNGNDLSVGLTVYFPAGFDLADDCLLSTTYGGSGNVLPTKAWEIRSKFYARGFGEGHLEVQV